MKSTTQILGLNKNRIQKPGKNCQNCKHHIPPKKREKNKVTKEKTACHLWGYPTGKLPIECPAKKPKKKKEEK